MLANQQQDSIPYLAELINKLKIGKKVAGLESATPCYTVFEMKD